MEQITSHYQLKEGVRYTAKGYEHNEWILKDLDFIRGTEKIKVVKGPKWVIDWEERLIHNNSYPWIEVWSVAHIKKCIAS